MFRTIENIMATKKIRELREEVGTDFVCPKSATERVDANILAVFEEAVHQFNYASRFLESGEHEDYLKDFPKEFITTFFNVKAAEINYHADFIKQVFGIFV